MLLHWIEEMLAEVNKDIVTVNSTVHKDEWQCHFNLQDEGRIDNCENCSKLFNDLDKNSHS